MRRGRFSLIIPCLPVSHVLSQAVELQSQWIFRSMWRFISRKPPVHGKAQCCRWEDLCLEAQAQESSRLHILSRYPEPSRFRRLICSSTRGRPKTATILTKHGGLGRGRLPRMYAKSHFCKPVAQAKSSGKASAARTPIAFMRPNLARAVPLLQSFLNPRRSRSGQ